MHASTSNVKYWSTWSVFSYMIINIHVLQSIFIYHFEIKMSCFACVLSWYDYCTIIGAVISNTKICTNSTKNCLHRHND